MTRTVWAVTAVAALVSSVAGFSVARYVGAEGETASALVPIVPCRLADTRSGSDNVGPRSTPIGPNETHTFQVTGTNGNCSIPAGATGIASNVTVVNPSASSFLTIFPAGNARPLAANLNWTATSSPTPNQVTVGLSNGGAITAYNLTGTIDVVIDIVGYYTLAPAGAPGPKGDTGAAGPKGDLGPVGDDGVVSVQMFGSGFNAPENLGAAQVVPIGDMVQVTVESGQALVASGTARLRHDQSADNHLVTLCYSADGVTGFNAFEGEGTVDVSVAGPPGMTYTRSARATPPVGQRFVGMCVINQSGALMTFNTQWSQGWVMVVNE